MQTPALWTSAEAASATGGRLEGGPWAATGIAIDSRQVMPGDLFIALKGEQTDGHAFLADAFKRGAVAAMVHEAPASPLARPLLVVPDTMVAFVALAARARDRSRTQVIAVTGSVGKTGTKEALKLALAAHGSTYASVGNLNSSTGAPLSLARLPADAVFAVLELGMNRAGEIAPNSRAARPHGAIVTNVEAVHLQFFPLSRRSRMPRRRSSKASVPAPSPCSTATTRISTGSPPRPARMAPNGSSASAPIPFPMPA